MLCAAFSDVLIICGWKRTCVDGRCYHVQSNVVGAGFVEKVWWFFFLLPLQFRLFSRRCNKNNTLVFVTKHSHTAAGRLLGLWLHAAQHTHRTQLRPNQIFEKGSELDMRTKSVSKGINFVHSVLALIDISKDHSYISYELSVRAVKHTQTLLLLLHTHSSGQTVPQKWCSKPCCQCPSSKKHNYRGPRLNNLKSIITDLYPNSSERYIKI